MVLNTVKFGKLAVSVEWACVKRVDTIDPDEHEVLLALETGYE